VPNVEELGNVIGDRDYVPDLCYSIFQDIDARRDVLVVMGDRWTIVEGAAFKAMAERLLPQL